MFNSIAFCNAAMKLTILFLHLMLLSEVIGAGQKTFRTVQVQERLYKDLLEDYRQNNRPVLHQESRLNVSFTFELIKIFDMNAKLQRLSVLGRVRQEWQDEALRWNSTKYSGFLSINIPPEKLWVPDIRLYNIVENKDHKKTGIRTSIIVYSNGTCRWSYPLFVYVMCSIDVSYFPLDLQKCSLRFGSITYAQHEVSLVVARHMRHVIPLYKNQEWMLYESNLVSRVLWDEKRNDNYSVVEITLKMERDALYFFVEMLIPCFLISCLTVLGFVLPPESGERMSLGMLILLAMTFFQQLTMKMVPLQYFPIISQYFFITTIEIGIALLVTTITLNFYYHSHSKMPAIMKVLILRYLARITRMISQSNDDDHLKQPRKTRRSSEHSEKKVRIFSGAIKKTAHAQFELTRREIHTGNENTDVNTRLNKFMQGTHKDKNGRPSDDVEQHVIKEEGPGDWNKDWVRASRIIDKFCMYVAIFIGILTIIIVFSRTPRFWSSREEMDG